MCNRAQQYASGLSRLIRAETVSQKNQVDKSKFYAFHQVLRGEFPTLFSVCEFEDFDGSMLLRWKGETAEAPILLMNHMDVVEASGNWTYPPFSGTIAQGKVWGRGTLDTKGGEHYLRIECIDHNGRVAWSNPIFFDSREG